MLASRIITMDYTDFICVRQMNALLKKKVAYKTKTWQRIEKRETFIFYLRLNAISKTDTENEIMFCSQFVAGIRNFVPFNENIGNLLMCSIREALR